VILFIIFLLKVIDKVGDIIGFVWKRGRMFGRCDASEKVESVHENNGRCEMRGLKISDSIRSQVCTISFVCFSS
jgi:hypothetical protein